MNGNPCAHNGCGQPTWRQRENTTAWSEVCCYGHRSYIFKDDHGNYETSAQRMNRLKRVCTCPTPGCGKTHERYDGGNCTEIQCDDCREKVNREYMLKKSRRVQARKKEQHIDEPAPQPYYRFGSY